MWSAAEALGGSCIIRRWAVQMSILTTFEKDHCFFLKCFLHSFFHSGSVQALSCLFPAHSTLASAVTWGPALWIDIWRFCFLPWNRGWTFYPMPLLCRLFFFFFKWPIAVPQPTLSPSVCVGMQHPQEHLLFSWPSLLTPTELSPLSWPPSHRFPFLLGNPLLKLEKGDWLCGNGILPIHMQLCVHVHKFNSETFFFFFLQQSLFICVNRAGTRKGKKHSCTFKPAGFRFLLKIICHDPFC